MTTSSQQTRDHTLPDAAPQAAPPTVRTCALLAALAAALAWNALRPGLPSDDSLEAPALRIAAPRCGLISSDREELALRTAQLASAARARVDHYPFRAAEGLSALALLEEAAACAALAGVDARALTANSRAFRARLLADYRDHALRVERARVAGHPARARADVEALVALLEGEDHAFARDVRNLRAELADGRTR